MKLALVGYSGYWGQKLARAATALGHTIVHKIDRSNIDDIDHVRADAAIIATPPNTHYSLAMRAMRNGLDVLVEKPMALSLKDAVAMTDYAMEEGLVLSVDSTFLHTASAEFLLDLGGSLLSYQSVRLAPPMPQAQINAAWDLVVHDIAILHRLSGAIVPGLGSVDGAVAQAALPLQSGGSAFIMASRVWTHKVREIVLHYPSGTYLWTLDGLSKEGKKIVEEKEEPLKRLIRDFEKRCLERQALGLTDGIHGTEVVGCLDRLFPHHTPFQIGQGRMGNGLHRWGTSEHIPVQNRQ